MITFIAHLRVRPENAQAFEDLMTHVTAMTLENEPGVAYYGFAKSVDDPDTYVVVEVYRDQAACVAHGQTAWLTESVPQFLTLIDGLPDIRQYVSPGTAPVAAQFDDLSVSTEGLETVRRFSRALGDRDLTTAESLLHRDLVVHTAGGLPYSGDYYGPQGFLELFAAMTQVLDLTPAPLSQQSARRTDRCFTGSDCVSWLVPRANTPR